MKTKKDAKLFIQVLVGYNGKESGGWLDLSEELKENGKMPLEEFKKTGDCLVDSALRSLQRQGAVEYYKDDDGMELVP